MRDTGLIISASLVITMKRGRTFIIIIIIFITDITT